MNINKLKLIVAVIAILPLLAFANSAVASEVTGNLSTGIGGTVTVIDGVVMVSPTATPVAGTYQTAQSVVLTATGSSSIHYTTDGTVPTCSTGTVYSGAIVVSSSKVITAISCYQGSYHSTTAAFGYAIVPASTGGGGSGNTTIPATLSAGNIKGYGVVDEYDFSMLMADWGKTGSSKADLNKDGVVDEYDFALVMANWGN